MCVCVRERGREGEIEIDERRNKYKVYMCESVGERDRDR